MSDPQMQQNKLGVGIKYDVNFQNIDYQTMHLLRMFIEKHGIPKGKVKIEEYRK